MKRSRRLCTVENGMYWHDPFSAPRLETSLMNRLVPLFSLLTIGFAATALAQETTNPIRYTWIPSACDTWNCAAAALVMANGEPNVLVLSTGHEEHPWLILRRVEEGSVYIPEEEPYVCDVFDSAGDAGTAFVAKAPCHGPLILSVPDGRTIVASLSKCDENVAKRRSAGH